MELEASKRSTAIVAPDTDPLVRKQLIQSDLRKLITTCPPTAVSVTPHQICPDHRSVRGMGRIDLPHKPGERIALTDPSGHLISHTDPSGHPILPIGTFSLTTSVLSPKAWRPILALTDPSGHSISHTDPSRAVILSHIPTPVERSSYLTYDLSNLSAHSA